MLAFGSSALRARSKRLLEILIRLGDCEDTNVIGIESVLLQIGNQPRGQPEPPPRSDCHVTMPNKEGDPGLSYPLTTDLTLLLLFRVPQSTARHVSDCWVGGQRNNMLSSPKDHICNSERFDSVKTCLTERF